MQISPFFDMALTKNVESGRMFDFKDGFYSCGIEVLVYPEKWKSYVVRASIGYDLGKKILSPVLNTDWRDPKIGSTELYFGLTVHY